MNLPNKLTVLRVIMVPFFVFFMLTDVGGPANKWIALVLFCVASLTDFIFFFNRLNQFIVNLLRITIKNSDPLDFGYFTKLAEQFMQRFLSI